jgi:hypothetical protein
MDRVDIHEDYDPGTHYRLELEDGKLTAEELAAKHGRSMDVAEEASANEAEPIEKPTSRLDE